VSEYLAAAAKAMGMPESIVGRSAESRAKAIGASVDDVLRAWAAGEEPEAGAGQAADQTEQPTVQEQPVEADTSEVAPNEPAPAEPPVEASAEPVAPPQQPLNPRPVPPPVLEGRSDRPFAVMLSSVAVLAVALLISFVSPLTASEDIGPIYSSAVPLSERGELGRAVYLQEGCNACHTQLVRPIVADAGLGGVTLSDSNQVLGSRRYGPDLMHVGSRYSEAELEQILSGSLNHAAYSLEEAALANLVAYLSESR